MENDLSDSIVAISTPLGEGGIGIVRLSGEGIFDVIKRIFRSSKYNDVNQLLSHRIYYGYIIDPDNNKTIDEVLLMVMRKPNTYTREDVVEINCHGGIVSVKKILHLCLLNGARMAEPGEFTKRAFLNGRIDLAQAEAVIDIIRAKTETSLDVAVDQLSGNLSETVRRINNEIINLLAHVEACIDFPEHDIDDITFKHISEKCGEVISKLNNLIESADTGKVLREGLRTVIVGKPNVGKSSLLNALLREKRAIVTEIPGTTRDVIEEVMNVRGVPLKIVDTAGIHETHDLVEKIGVDRTKSFLQSADLILFVVDASRKIESEDIQILEMIHDKKVIFLVNKIDLPLQINKSDIEKFTGHKPFVELSVKENKGLDCLEDMILSLFFAGDVSFGDQTIVTNVRHQAALEKAKQAILDVEQAIDNEVSIDLLSIDLKNAWEYLGEITGESVEENIIDRIFSQFCIGK